MAVRYGVLPSTILELDPGDLALTIACYQEGTTRDRKLAAASGAMTVYDVRGGAGE